LEMADQREGAGALPTGEDAAGCGPEAAESSRDKNFGSEMSEPDQTEGAQNRAEEGAAAANAVKEVTEHRSVEETSPLYGEAMRRFHTRRRAIMEAADERRAEELKLNTVPKEGSKYLNPDQVVRLISIAREVGKDPLDLIGMLDDMIEETLRSRGGQCQREIFQAVKDSIERFRRNLDQGEARTDSHFRSNLETNFGTIQLTSRVQGHAREHVLAPRTGRTLRFQS
jgi:hypothetical protein